MNLNVSTLFFELALSATTDEETLMGGSGSSHEQDTAKCADCDVDTIDNGEFYMVRDEVWAAAWVKSGCEFLCIGCLEQRLGRTLVRADFTDCLLNVPDKLTSARMRNRLLREQL